MYDTVALQSKMDEVDGKPWQPIDIAHVNDQIVRLAYGRGEYPWHTHNKADEMFYLIKGEFVVRIKDHGEVEMKEGDFLTIPKGIEHAPYSNAGGFVLIFEPKETVSRGD